MSYALYGESLGYVHLVAHEDRDTLIEMFFQDIEDVGVKPNEIYNIFAVFGKEECRALQQMVIEIIQNEC